MKLKQTPLLEFEELVAIILRRVVVLSHQRLDFLECVPQVVEEPAQLDFAISNVIILVNILFKVS